MARPRCASNHPNVAVHRERENIPYDVSIAFLFVLHHKTRVCNAMVSYHLMDALICLHIVSYGHWCSHCVFSLETLLETLARYQWQAAQWPCSMARALRPCSPSQQPVIGCLSIACHIMSSQAQRAAHDSTWILRQQLPQAPHNVKLTCPGWNST
jgi:hypothetical protein